MKVYRVRHRLCVPHPAGLDLPAPFRLIKTIQNGRGKMTDWFRKKRNGSKARIKLGRHHCRPYSPCSGDAPLGCLYEESLTPGGISGGFFLLWHVCDEGFGGQDHGGQHVFHQCDGRFSQPGRAGCAQQLRQNAEQRPGVDFGWIRQYSLGYLADLFRCRSRSERKRSTKNVSTVPVAPMASAPK